MIGTQTGWRKTSELGQYVLDNRLIGGTRGAFYVWDAKRSYLGCVIPKVGCTSWLHYLRRSSLPDDEFEEASRFGYMPKSFDEYGLHFRTTKMTDLRAFEGIANNKTFFKWAVVRHPWRRLVSGFRSKYEGECNFRRQCLVERFNIPLPETSIDTVVTFHEFVLALARVDPEKLDRHFRPAFILCELDRVPYNFIGDLHSPQHMDHISNMSGFSTTFTELESSSAAEIFGPKYYGGRTHSMHSCSLETVEAARAIYQQDLSLLGFDLNDALHSCGTHGLTFLPHKTTQHKKPKKNKQV